MQDALFVPIGKLGKSHGVSGALRIFVDERYLDDFLATDLLFVEIEGRKLPFFIEDILEANDLLVKFEEVDSPEAAHRYSGKAVFMREADLQPLQAEAAPAGTQFERYIGYQICDRHIGCIAAIDAVIELPQQFLASVSYKGKEVLLPMHPDLIERVDHQQRQIWMNLPEGILDV
ncbi:MAG: ribosome maturation factor RimM [Saprospiraceae bacterium]|jgi:16S rRNA processing protein RimM